MDGTSFAISASSWSNRPFRTFVFSVMSLRSRSLVTARLQYVMLLDGFLHPSHGTVKLESGDVTQAYSAMSQLPAEVLSGPEPNRTFGGTSRISRSIPIALRFSL